MIDRRAQNTDWLTTPARYLRQRHTSAQYADGAAQQGSALRHTRGSTDSDL